MFNVEGAKKLFAEVKPERWRAAVQTLIIDCVERLDALENGTADVKLVRAAKNAAKAIGPMKEFFDKLQARMAGNTAAASSASAPAPSAPAPAAAPASDAPAGSQEEVEAQMDNAIAGTPAMPVREPGRRSRPAVGGAPSAPAPSNGNGNGGSTRVGADGQPLSAEQAALEEQMDGASS